MWSYWAESTWTISLYSKAVVRKCWILSVSCFERFRSAYMYWRLKIQITSSSQFSPEEYLYRSGEIASEMYFVVSGSVDELTENSEVRYWQLFNFAFFWITIQGGDSQQTVNKIDKTVRSGHGTGELSFFFGMRHIGKLNCSACVSWIVNWLPSSVHSGRVWTAFSFSKSTQSNRCRLYAPCTRTIFTSPQNVPWRWGDHCSSGFELLWSCSISSRKVDVKVDCF